MDTCLASMCGMSAARSHVRPNGGHPRRRSVDRPAMLPPPTTAGTTKPPEVTRMTPTRRESVPRVCALGPAQASDASRPSCVVYPSVGRGVLRSDPVLDAATRSTIETPGQPDTNKQSAVCQPLCHPIRSNVRNACRIYARFLTCQCQDLGLAACRASVPSRRGAKTAGAHMVRAVHHRARRRGAITSSSRG